MLKYLLFFMLAAPAVNAQTNNDNKLIRHIDRFVASVKKDTTLRFRQHSGAFTKSGAEIMIAPEFASTYYYDDSAQVRVHISRNTFAMMNFMEKDLYFQKGQLVYFYESTTNSSRMGSCGTVTATYQYYLKDGELIRTVAEKEKNFYINCYGNMGPKNLIAIMALVKNL